MLVLSRKRDGRIVLKDPAWGYKIELLVVAIRDDKVRLGIEAPPAVTIWRDEIKQFRGETGAAGRRQPAEEETHVRN